jgi:hypothetical protein
MRFQGTASAGKFAKTIVGEPKLRRDKQQRGDNAWSTGERDKQHKVLERVLQVLVVVVLFVVCIDVCLVIAEGGKRSA